MQERGSRKRMKWFAVAGSGALALGTISEAAAKTPARSTNADRVVLEQALPKLDGNHLQTTVVEVTYGPGAQSAAPHIPAPWSSTSGSGALRAEVGPSQIVYGATTFYEDPGEVHRVSANASRTESATFLATFICDHAAAELSSPFTAPPGASR